MASKVFDYYGGDGGYRTHDLLALFRYKHKTIPGSTVKWCFLGDINKNMKLLFSTEKWFFYVLCQKFLPNGYK